MSAHNDKGRSAHGQRNCPTHGQTSIALQQSTL
ncbi:hypothetical protein CSOJ01_15764 [Colletotrichum sojae]|uniref:Uncharacterized protein n=1 Tax=Colletotrichum sojae TaxID=2175907 RepID=A0A8H6IM89_9PEZI|nr:hypothetical protein CSOJ01_15764 [Colletotrichum sojae]